MAFTTKNEYTGDGSNTLFSFTFPYIEFSDVKVSVDEVLQDPLTEYAFVNATTIGFTDAPSNGSSIVIFRQTSSDELKFTFFPGSSIRARDLNDNFTQTLFSVQESETGATDATEAAEEAAASAKIAADAAEEAATQAGEAQTAAAEAVLTANRAEEAANNAEESATDAEIAAEQAQQDAATALNAVQNVLNYTLVPNVAAIPSSPGDAEAVEVTDSTGIESFSPLDNLPAGFTGESGLYVRMVFRNSSSSWEFIQYGANDPESRYLAAGDNVSELVNDAGYVTAASIPTAPVTSVAGKTGVVTLVKADITDFSDGDYATAAQGALADSAAQPTGTTYTGTLGTTERTITAGAFDLATGNHWTCGAITVPNPTNASAGTSGLIRITAGPVVWSSNFKFPGGSAPTIETFPSIIPFYVQGGSNILMGNVAEGIS